MGIHLAITCGEAAANEPRITCNATAGDSHDFSDDPRVGYSPDETPGPTVLDRGGRRAHSAGPSSFRGRLRGGVPAPRRPTGRGWHAHQTEREEAQELLLGALRPVRRGEGRAADLHLFGARGRRWPDQQLDGP